MEENDKREQKRTEGAACSTVKSGQRIEMLSILYLQF